MFEEEKKGEDTFYFYLVDKCKLRKTKFLSESQVQMLMNFIVIPIVHYVFLGFDWFLMKDDDIFRICIDK